MSRKTLHIAWRLALGTVLAALAISGCGDLQMAGVGTGGTGTIGGGGGGATASVTSNYKASLTASTVDSHLINAIVFLDTNNNYRFDGGEPYTVTGVDGSGTLEATPAEMAAAPVVAVALKGVAIDSSTMQPLLTTYVLSAPKASATTGSNIITPISTQLRELLETGRYTTVQQAMDALAGQIGLPPDINLLAENIVAGNPALNAAAKSIAALMWMQSSHILDPGSATPALDVERYRTMMKLIENNINIVSRLNTPENLINLNSNISVVLEAMPKKQ